MTVIRHDVVWSEVATTATTIVAATTTKGRTAGHAQNGTGALHICVGPSKLLALRPGRAKKPGAAADKKSEQEPTSTPCDKVQQMRKMAHTLHL